MICIEEGHLPRDISGWMASVCKMRYLLVLRKGGVKKTEEKKIRRQVTFNVNDDLYTAYKQAMIGRHTTPTANITEHIRKVVEEARANGEIK